MFTSVHRFLGSIKLAVPLLSLIVGILIWATFYESQVGSAVVSRMVYKSSWFGTLMFLLALNLSVSALSRYPWRGARKIGFALTHFGLIVLIAGAAAVIHLGVEGMLPLRTDLPANSQIRVEGDLLEVLSPQGEVERVDLFVRDDGSINPSTAAGLKLLAYDDNAIKTVSFTDTAPVYSPAVHLQLDSDRMGQSVQRWLAIAPENYSQIEIGPASLEIALAETESQLKEFLAPPPETDAFFRVAIAPDQTLHYAANSSNGFVSGLFTADTIVEPGWADFRISLLEFVPHAQIQREVVPVPPSVGEGNPALLVETASGTKAWLPYGEPTAIANAVTSNAGNETEEIFAAFAPKMLQLPFVVKLEDFIVDRNEGTDSVAMWTSQIQITNPFTGESSDRRVWMNHPTWFEGWKLAQASWNPGDLRQSTLQVKREPAWVTALTWFGSALVVVGIGVMFYGRSVIQSVGSSKLAQALSSNSDATIDPTELAQQATAIAANSDKNSTEVIEAISPEPELT
ncbi:hypothetical protein Pse7367_2672 [Thalassoporum mexicanum PCC 7367]|uniref:cytochrome c biogenesis protein ResB n=1 Tax=Thalassoporum mexicanum TaxID=3457544 RepID=UPI00029FA862|nr:cytochrome c biogenesis protein ResB [Pseudanabaena sp. PCC 7367]AFY70927.1 hypothetical protein Pse7367_2672 [Pseudanabaena sp. PCC 7367]